MKKILSTTCLVLLFIQVTQAQSPWTRDKGKAYVQAGYTGLFYSSYIIDGKKVEGQDKYSDMTIQAYGEYGITNKLEALVMLPYKIVGRDSAASGNQESLPGFGNITLGFKYKIYDKNWKVSAGITFNANSIIIDLNKGLSTGFNANTIIPFLSAGSSSGKWYYFANIGYGYMDNNYSDFFKATFEVGYEIISKGHLMFVLDTRNIVKKESAFKNELSQWPSFLDRQTYNAIGIKANYEYVKDKLGANFAVYGATGIDNAALAPTLNFGLYIKL